MTIFPGCKCCGPCWRCHTKRKTPTVTALSSTFPVDTNETTGLPNGSVFTLDEIIYNDEDRGEEVICYNFSYTSPNQKNCPSGAQATNIRMQVRIGYFGVSPELPFQISIEGDETSSVSIDNFITGDDSCSLVYIRDQSGPGETEKVFASGILCDEIVDGQPVGGRGRIQFEIDRIDLNNKDPDYKCFDAPPDEDGWQPVGDCHPDEESCQAACPPDTIPPGGRTMPTTKTTGPGTRLAEMLKAWGIHPKKSGGCKCKDMEVKMNRLGGACLEPKNLKMIVDHLQAEAKKRHLPFVRKVGEMLVKRAVKRFKNNS